MAPSNKWSLVIQLQWRRLGMVNSSAKGGACKSSAMWGFATSTEIYGAGYYDICL
jgi:hypothetical protein